MSQSLGLVLEQACRRFGDAPALQAPGLAWSHAALAQQAQAVAAQLRAAGLLADEPVLVMVSNQPADIAALMAVWLAGGVVVAVHRSTPAALLAALQQRTGARWGIDLPHPHAKPGLERWADLPPPPRPLLAGAAFIIFTSGSTGEPKGVVLSHAAFAGKLEQIDSLLHF